MAEDLAMMNLEASLADSVKDLDLDNLDPDTGFEDVQGQLLKERIMGLAKLGPDSSKQDLIDAFDITFQTANNLLMDYAAFRDLPEDMIKDVTFFMAVLEACVKVQDSTFKAYAQKQAGGLQRTMAYAMKRKRLDHRPPDVSNIKVPSSVKLDPEVIKHFAEGLSQFLWSRLAMFHILEPETDAPLPFILSTEFADKFIKGVHKHIIPWILNKKAVQTLVGGMPGHGGHAEYLRVKFNHEGNNPTKNYWELGFKSAVSDGDKPSTFKTFWNELCESPAEGTYIPPKPEDYMLFKDIFSFQLSNIRSGVVGIQQVLEQEASGAGREGSTRDYLCNLARGLMFHTGDLIAVWAHFTYPDKMSDDMRNGFVRSMGRSDSERRRYAPYFMHFVMNDEHVMSDV